MTNRVGSSLLTALPIGASVFLVSAARGKDPAIDPTTFPNPARQEASAAAPREQRRIVISVSDAVSLARDAKIVIIQTGNEEGYSKGHLPGAHLVAHEDTMSAHGEGGHGVPEIAAIETLLARLGATPESRFLLYGPPLEVAWLYMVLDSTGLGDRTFVLDGGATAWRAAGHPLSTEAPQPKRGSIRLNKSTDVVVDASWVKERLNTPGRVLLDVRSEEEYDKGHIPGGRRISWQATTEDRIWWRLKSRDELQQTLRAAGVREGDQVVTYCLIGMRASVLYLIARHLGYDARVYQGSWADWSGRPGFPVSTAR